MSSVRTIPERTTEFIQTPPHPDQVENALSSELEMLLQRQTALAEERVKALESEMQKLNENMRITRERARLSLTAFVKATVTLRLETERISDVARELNEGLKHIDDSVRKASNGNGH